MKKRNAKADRLPKAPAALHAAASTNAALPAVAQPRRRRWLFRLAAAVLVPVVSLAALEVVLRIAGFGHPTSFFVPRQIQGERVLVENPFFGLSYFPPALARAASPLVMPAAKPPGTFRIFLLGESAALGDPRPAYGLGRCLQTLLNKRFPGMNFEVISAAMTAINSHALLPIARECAKLQGDLWIVYMGNNEVAGPFGASTVFGPKAPPWVFVRLYLALQRTRVGQGIAALARQLRSADEPAVWGGLKMFQDQQLAPADPRREQVYRNFQANLTSIVRAGTAARVPVILCSVASNLKDCPPFGSLPPSGLAAEQLARWKVVLQTGATNEARRQWADAARSYQEAARLAPRNPDLQFRLGECFLQLTNLAEADQCLRLARDLDALPFRADSRINRIIAETATQFAHQRVRFVDAEETLAAASSAHIPGEESFYEHVHLNFAGNYRLARALAEHAAQCLPFDRVAKAASDWADEPTCARRLALTDWNRQPILEEMKSRLDEPPFSAQAGHQARLDRVEQQIKEIQVRLRSSSARDARLVYEEALKSRPKDHWLHHNYAEYLARVGQLEQATAEMREVCKLVPQHYSAYFHTGRLLARQKKFDEADQALQIALTLRPEFTDTYLELGRLCVSRGDRKGALKYCALAQQRHFDDGRLQVLEAKVLQSLGRRPEAIRCLRAAIRLQPALWEAHDLLGAQLGLDGDFAQAQLEFEQVVRLQPDYAEGHLNLGIALARQQRFPEALGQFQEALRLDPQNRKAQEFLKTIGQLQKQEP